MLFEALARLCPAICRPLALMAACGSWGATKQFDGFWQDGTITLAAPGEAPAWTIQPGNRGVVLVMYRSEAGSSHGGADNEELVVQLSPAELAAGNAVALESPGRIVRYQRGGRRLTYASKTVKGTLTLKREADRVRGQVSLTASAPIVNVTGGSDEVTRQFSFQIDHK